MKKLLFLSLVVFLAMLACGKKDSNNTPTGPTVPADAPKYITHTITIPAKMSSSADTHAQTVVYYMGMANALSASLGNYFLPPSLNKAGALDGDGPWEYSWTDGELTVTVHIKVVGENYVWEVYYTGKKNDFSVSSWLGVNAEQAKNERSGSFTSFVPPGASVAANFNWSLDTADALMFEVIAPAFLAGSRFVGQVNTDHSGNLEVHQLAGDIYVLAQKYQWDTQGAGQWWEYENDVVKNSGQWD
jgi:hypothetical protein